MGTTQRQEPTAAPQKAEHRLQPQPQAPAQGQQLSVPVWSEQVRPSAQVFASTWSSTRLGGREEPQASHAGQPPARVGAHPCPARCLHGAVTPRPGQRPRRKSPSGRSHTQAHLEPRGAQRQAGGEALTSRVQDPASCSTWGVVRPLLCPQSGPRKGSFSIKKKGLPTATAAPACHGGRWALQCLLPPSKPARPPSPQGLSLIGVKCRRQPIARA